MARLQYEQKYPRKVKPPRRQTDGFAIALAKRDYTLRLANAMTNPSVCRLSVCRLRRACKKRYQSFRIINLLTF